MKYILNLDLSIFEYFPSVENKWIENYLISKYGNVLYSIGIYISILISNPYTSDFGLS